MVIILLVLSFFVLLNLIKKYEKDMMTERYVVQQKILISNTNISIEVEKSMKTLKNTEEELSKIIRSNNMKLKRLNTKLNKELIDYNPAISILSKNTNELIKKLLLSNCLGGENV